MVNPLSAMVRSLEIFDLYKFGQLYVNKHITNAKLHKFQQIDQRKNLRVSQNLDIPKNVQTPDRKKYSVILTKTGAACFKNF